MIEFTEIFNAESFNFDGGLTTALILAWLAIFTLSATVAGMFFCNQASSIKSTALTKRDGSAPRSNVPIIVPSLALAPIAIFAAWATARVNLIFPVFEFADTVEIVVAAIAPAFLLFIGSGLLLRVVALSRSEWAYWYSKPFVRVEQAFGKNVQRRLAPMIGTRVLLQSASDCLPLVFSELVIIESIFNAPGLGFWSWEYAKTRDIGSAAKSIAVLFIAYGLINLAIYFANKNLGKKLTGYV